MKLVGFIYFLAVLPLFSNTRAADPKSDRQNDSFRSRFYRLNSTSADRPYVERAVHSVGNVWITVSNQGQFGIGPTGVSLDPVTGMETPSCMFPANSQVEHLYVGGFWIGAVVGRDTLVSIGIDDYYDVLEFWPDPLPTGEITRKSITTSSPFYSEDARAELDVIATYTDTVTNSQFVSIDNIDGRPHVPLNIEITERSHSWSYEYAEDFILFDYSIKNIGRKSLEKVYMAIYIDGDVHHKNKTGAAGWTDDNCGFRRYYPAPGRCDFTDTINVAYIMDNDGDPDEESGEFYQESAKSLAGVRVIRTPSDSLEYSFNWWATDYGSATNDFGPRQAQTASDPFRDMNGVMGTPLGDRNKYYIMRHREFDYDQLFAGKDHTAEGWLPRPPNSVDIADGYDARYLLSFGPFDIYPGEILPVSFAWVCAENIHVNPGDFEDYYQYLSPETYYGLLDFEDLAANSNWASWIYDNPGVDTDNDGDSGAYRVCVYDSLIITDDSVVYTGADTIWYKGDGIPDFKGAAPPPPPELWLISPYPIGDTLRSMIYPAISEFNDGLLTIRWYGYRSENTRDIFSNQYDFEGYRVWYSLSDRPDDFVLLASYDRPDYNKYIYNSSKNEWELLDPPFDNDSLESLYGTGFSPEDHSRDNPLYWRDSAFYFVAQDWNQSDLSDTLGIYKVYPDEPPPTSLNHDTARVYYPEQLTEFGYFKYYMYEFRLRRLLPSQKYYLAVTTFDYGSPGHGLKSLETKPTQNMIAEYAQNSVEEVARRGLNVVVYPNPYRADANYREIGFEGRGQETLSEERIRAIHFANLPAQCKIRIFSLDGDLVREIDHNREPGDPRAMHDQWDLITRNTQAVVSGIYYYSVESTQGNQVGKLVIIM